MKPRQPLTPPELESINSWLDHGELPQIVRSVYPDMTDFSANTVASAWRKGRRKDHKILAAVIQRIKLKQKTRNELTKILNL